MSTFFVKKQPFTVRSSVGATAVQFGVYYQANTPFAEDGYVAVTVAPSTAISHPGVRFYSGVPDDINSAADGRILTANYAEIRLAPPIGTGATRGYRCTTPSGATWYLQAKNTPTP